MKTVFTKPPISIQGRGGCWYKGGSDLQSDAKEEGTMRLSLAFLDYTDQTRCHGTS